MTYTHLIEKGYMSEIWGYRKIPLGHTERYFIGTISESQKSAYDIFLEYRNLSLEKHGMAYKNVHKRIKTLEKLALVEPVEGKFRRNAIKYRLTSYGLFQRLLTSSRPFDYTPPTVLEPYMKKNPVMKTLLYQYFEGETVKAFLESSLMYSMLLADYLRETCETIINKLEEWKSKSFQYNWPMNYAMDELITIKAKSFISLIVMFLKRDGYTKLDITQDSNRMDQQVGEDNVKAVRALSKDQKFITLLMNVKDDFDGGCEVLL